MERIGIFGGTFDPPHLGHLIAAQDVVEVLGLDRMLLVPAAGPPHKPAGDPAPAETRARMVEAAVEGHPSLEASRIELYRGGTSYTVDTLRSLREQRPGDELFLVIGADQLEGFPAWRFPAEILRLARLVAMSRRGAEPRSVPAAGELSWEAVTVTRVDVSSTDVRRRVGEGRSIRYWVPDAVRRIIEDELLYRPRRRAG